MERTESVNVVKAVVVAAVTIFVYLWLRSKFAPSFWASTLLAKLRLEPRPIRDGSSPSAQQHPPRTGLTFRVRGVPPDWAGNRLQSFLADQDDSASPAIRSLAHEVHGRSLTATVAFRKVPRQLQEALRKGQPWQIPLPVGPDEDSRPRNLAVDDAFLGITTFYAPPSPHHQVE